MDEQELVYGLPMPTLPEGLQPISCLVLIKGIDMETGAKTISSMGSEDMTPWEAVGMMSIESARLKMHYTVHSMEIYDDDDEDDEV